MGSALSFGGVTVEESGSAAIVRQAAMSESEQLLQERGLFNRDSET